MDSETSIVLLDGLLIYCGLKIRRMKKEPGKAGLMFGITEKGK